MKKITENPVKFTIFIYGQSLNSIRVQENIRKFCIEMVKENYQIEVVDLAKEPERAVEHNILAVPTTIVEAGGSRIKLIGTLQDLEKLSEILLLETG